MGNKAIVTSGDLGIGKTLVRKLLRDGWDVVFSMNEDIEAAKEILREAKTLGRACYAFKADFSDADAANPFFETAIEKLGGLDLLVNNSRQSFSEPLPELTEESIDSILNQNIRTYIIMMRNAAKYMKENGVKGEIINITSPRTQRIYEMFAKDMEAYGVTISSDSTED